MQGNDKDVYQNSQKFYVLGIRVDVIQLSSVIDRIEKFVESSETGRFVIALNSHLIMEGCKDPVFREVLNSSDISVPDGMPLLWLAKTQRFIIKRRVCGSDIMEFFLHRTGKKYAHFLYGGKPATTEKLVQVLNKKYPDVKIAGFYSPPFRQLNEKEDADIIDLINKARPDILWVGLGAPKQEKWIYEHRRKLKVPVMIGVGAAFDFLSSAKLRAPGWMRESGLEWLFRLITEPRRLWYRYLVLGPKFAIYIMLQYFGIKKINKKDEY